MAPLKSVVMPQLHKLGREATEQQTAFLRAGEALSLIVVAAAEGQGLRLQVTQVRAAVEQGVRTRAGQEGQEQAELAAAEVAADTTMGELLLVEREVLALLLFLMILLQWKKMFMMFAQ